jgi:hypothetical protein
MAVGRRFLVVLAALCAPLSVLAATASAAPVQVSDVVARPIAFNGTCAPGAGASAPDAPAATHRDFCVAFNLNTATDDVKKLTISLPAGVVGDPGATPRCTFPADSSSAGNCTAVNQVGDVKASASLDGLGATLNLAGEIYNITPHAGEPARLGIALHPSPSLPGVPIGDTFLQTAIRVRVPDAGLDSITADVPNTASGLPISLKSQSLKLWGSNAPTRHGTMAKPFMTLPTRCDTPAHSTVSVQSYGGESTAAPADFNVTQCDQVPFTPDLEVGPTTAPADTPGEAWAKLIVPTADTGSGDNARRQAYLKDVALQLPAGLALNPPLANGLIPCTPEQFAKDVDAKPGCPDNTVMGTVEFRTPIFPGEVLGGKVYFGTPLPGKPLVNFISVEDPRLRVKLVGYATIDPDTTAITAHFEDQPQVPFESFKFTYIDPGDGRATLTSPTVCTTYPVTAAMTPWGGGATKAPTKTFDVNDCPAPAFTPTISASVSNPTAGGDTGLSVHIERPDRQKRLEQLTVSLPAGLTGRLPAVPACKVADARSASCPDASQVGTAAVAVGTGKAPLNLPGKVYLTEGFENAIAGLAVVVDTKVPALDLGKVAVLQKLVLRPDTGIDVVSEALPQKLQGIPTVYRSIDLTIDKPGFMRNATSCGAQQIHATFSSVGGEMTAASDAPYQATGCESLPFAPKIATKLGANGETGTNKHPPLQVTITQADGEAAQARTVVTLPENIGVDLKNLGGLCTDAQLQSSSCPANSKIGTVTADTPLLPQQLSGGVYLVTPDKPGLPGIALDLGLVRLKGSVEIKGRLTTTFASIPDVPLRKLTLNLTGGPKGSLTTTVDQCTKKPVFDATFGSQSGKTLSVKSPAELVGCLGVASSSSGLRVTGALTGLRKKRPAFTLKATSPKALKELRITLPKQLKASSKALRTKGRLLMAGKRTKKGTLRVTSGRLSFKTPKGKSTKSLSVSLPRGILKLGKGKTIKVGQKLTFTIRAVGTNGKAETVKLTLKTRK